MCRNRYQRMKAPSKTGKEGKNLCKKCGQVKRGHTCTAEDAVVIRALPAEVAAAAAREGGASIAVSTAMPPPSAMAAERPARDHAFQTGVSGRPPRGRPRVHPKPASLDLGDLFTPEGEAQPLAAHSLLSPVSGNNFKIDVDGFLAEVNRREHENRPPLGSLASFNVGPVSEPSTSAMPHASMLGVCLLPEHPPPSADKNAYEEAAMTPANYLASDGPPAIGGGYLATAGPPPVAPTHKNLPPASRSLAPASFGALSVGSLISDRADLVDISDLQSAADAALAAKSAATLGESSVEASSSSDGRTADDASQPCVTAADLAAPAHAASIAAAAAAAAAAGDAAAGGGEDAVREAVLKASRALALARPDEGAYVAYAIAPVKAATAATPLIASAAAAPVAPTYKNLPPLASRSLAPTSFGPLSRPSFGTLDEPLDEPLDAPIPDDASLHTLVERAVPLSHACSRADSPLPIPVEEMSQMSNVSDAATSQMSADLSSDYLLADLEHDARSASTDTAPYPPVPTLMTLPSWSRAPSFSFADNHRPAALHA